MKTQLALLSALLALIAGCATPPATKVSYNPQTGQFILDSPKQQMISNITIELPNGAKFHADSMHAYNDEAVLGVLAAQNVKQGDQLLQAMQMLEKAAAKGATGGIAP